MNKLDSPGDQEPSHRPWAAGRAPLLWVAAPMLAGYAFSARWPDAPMKILVPLAAFFAAAALVSAAMARTENFSRNKLFPLWGACAAASALFLAWAWHGALMPRPPRDWLELPPREATLTLRIEQMFAASPDGASAAGLARIEAGPEILPELPGQRVYFRLRTEPGEPLPARGAVLEARGLLAFLPTISEAGAATPAERSAAGFRDYLHGQGVWFEFTRARATREVFPPSRWRQWLDVQNARCEAVLRAGPSGLESRFGNIYVGMILGRISALDENQRAAFSLLGVMHLFAISGLNVGILAGALWWCWRRTPGMPRLAGDLLTVALCWLYVEITGGSPSARRAALMFTFYVAAGWLGRPHGALPSVTAAGVLNLILDPAALWSPGFQLSYGVVFGLILYAPPLLALARTRWMPWKDLPVASRAPWQKVAFWSWDKVLGLAVVSWTALLCSAPLTAEYFGVFSPGGLLLNLLLVPLAAVATCAGAVAMAAGIAGFAPFTWIVWLADGLGLVCTGLMQIIAEAAVRVPGLHARLHLEPRWAGGVAALCVLAAMLFALPRKRSPRVWYYVLPVAILAVFAAFSARLD